MERLDRMIACLKQAGMRPKVDNFQQKLIIQKAMCLLSLLGMKTGYSFSLYVRGPYSPDLTKDLYAHTEQVEKLESSYKLNEKEVEMVEKVLEISDKLDPTMLEVAATYAFLWKGMGKNVKEALIELKRLKPFYSAAQIAVGVSRAKELFPPSEEEVKRMKAEMADWEAAAVEDMKY